MEIKNLTPHNVNLLVNGEFVSYQPTGLVPRVDMASVPVDGDYPFKAYKVEYGDVQNLPEPEDGVILIVSKMCADARPNRRDLWYPTELVRDEQGRIVGCEGLACLAF